MIKLKYFTENEFACKCGCGRGFKDMNEEAMLMLDEARDLAGIPFIINSAFRCPEHNKAVGSTSDNHTSGRAFDIKCEDSVSRLKILLALLGVGFRRIGIHESFIHADIMDRQPNGSLQCIWMY